MNIKPLLDLLAKQFSDSKKYPTVPSRPVKQTGGNSTQTKPIKSWR